MTFFLEEIKDNTIFYRKVKGNIDLNITINGTYVNTIHICLIDQCFCILIACRLFDEDCQ